MWGGLRLHICVFLYQLSIYLELSENMYYKRGMFRRKKEKEEDKEKEKGIDETKEYTNADIVSELKNIQSTLDKPLKQQMLNRFFIGLAGGLGTILGATLLLSVLLWILQQAKGIQLFEPLIEQIISIIENSP